MLAAAVPWNDLTTLVEDSVAAFRMALGLELVERHTSSGYVALVDENQALLAVERRICFAQTIDREKIVLAEENEDALRQKHVLLEFANLLKVVNVYRAFGDGGASDADECGCGSVGGDAPKKIRTPGRRSWILRLILAD